MKIYVAIIDYFHDGQITDTTIKYVGFDLEKAKESCSKPCNDNWINSKGYIREFENEIELNGIDVFFQSKRSPQLNFPKEATIQA